MFKTFSSRFLIIYILATLIIFFVLFITLTQTVSNHFINTRYQKLFTELPSVEAEYYNTYIQGTFDKKNFNTRLYNYSQQSGSRILIVNPTHQVVFDSNPHEYSLIDTTLTHDFVTRILSGETLSEVDTFMPYMEDQIVTIGSPLEYNGVLYGGVLLLSPYPSISADIHYVYTLIIVSFLILIFITFISNYIFSRNIGRIFRTFNRTTKAIASGDFSARIKDSNFSNEVRELTESINYMAEELEKLEDLRQDFIANISHDFRSPLTSIRGYVQAVIDGTIPPENHEKYLSVVLNETDRLTNLTNDILLLIKMENAVLTPDMKDFDLHQILRHILLRFEQTIIEKNIQMTLLLEEKSIYVHADYNQIQRAITNIIDNALKFCRIGDKVTIKTTTIDQKAHISITDSGPGIAENDLNNIWLRFHKVDRSRGKDRKGVGLGLSIVREIIKAHEQTIDVSSKLGEGTTFTFTLDIGKKNYHHS